MTLAVTFAPADGSVSIEGCCLTLAVGCARDVAARELSRFVRSHRDHGNGYEWLALDGVSLGGQRCGLSLGFHLGRLKEVHWGVALEGARAEAGWPARAAIDEEIAFVRGVLAQQFGRSFASGHERFAWGTVWSDFDAKGFQARSGLRYGS